METMTLVSSSPVMASFLHREVARLVPIEGLDAGSGVIVLRRVSPPFTTLEVQQAQQVLAAHDAAA